MKIKVPSLDEQKRIVEKRKLRESLDKLNREDLEERALNACPAELYHDLRDSIKETTDKELKDLIEKSSFNVN